MQPDVLEQSGAGPRLDVNKDDDAGEDRQHCFVASSLPDIDMQVGSVRGRF